jgi:hypothetical protein
MIQAEEFEKGGACILTLPILRRDMAILLASRPESIARAIKELRDSGIAMFNGRIVSVPDLAALYIESSQQQPRQETKQANFSD